MEIVQQLALEAYRLRLLGGLDDLLRMSICARLAGVDEVGRGCLAGPVVAAAVIPHPEFRIPGVDDSKQLSAPDRESLADVIRSTSIASTVGVASSAEIDRCNILEATRMAMVRALNALEPQPDGVVVDAVKLPRQRYFQLHLVRGDAVSYSIACASIIAKVERDQLMTKLDRVYPQYGFARHKGYAAAEHRQALVDFGPTPIHRLTFRSVVPRTVETLH